MLELLHNRKARKSISAPVGYVLYVNAATGSDLSSGSLIAPLRTIAAANALAGAADPSARFTIFYSGTFPGVVVGRSNIEYVPYVSGLIDANGANGFDLGGFDSVGISNAEITNAAPYAVYASGGSGHSLANLYIHGVAAGVRMVGCNAPEMLGGIIVGTTSGEGVYFQDGSGGVIAGVDGSHCAKRVAYANHQPGVVLHHLYAHDADNYDSLSNYAVEVENGCDGAVLFAIWAYRCNNGLIIKTSDGVLGVANVAWANFNYGGYMKGATNSVFEYNDFYGNGNGVAGGANIAVLQDDNGGAGPNVGSVGNTIRYNVSSGAVTYGVRTDPLSSGNVYHDQDYFGNAVAVGRTPSTVYASLAAWQADFGDAGSTEIDPQYNSIGYGGFVSGALTDKGHAASTFTL